MKEGWPILGIHMRAGILASVNIWSEVEQYLTNK